MRKVAALVQEVQRLCDLHEAVLDLELAWAVALSALQVRAICAGDLLPCTCACAKAMVHDGGCKAIGEALCRCEGPHRASGLRGCYGPGALTQMALCHIRQRHLLIEAAMHLAPAGNPAH